MSERNVHLFNGILIGMGIMLIALGFLGWFLADYLYGTFSRAFEEVGLDPSRHFIFREIKHFISSYMVFIVAGFVSLLFGVLFERKHIIINIEKGKSPRGRLAGALCGGGGALALLSLGHLFYYLLTSDYFYLEFFIVSEPIGIFLIILGIIIYTRK